MKLDHDYLPLDVEIWAPGAGLRLAAMAFAAVAAGAVIVALSVWGVLL